MLHRLLALSLIPLVSCQFPPTPEGVTTLKSKYHDGVKISYKEPGICETTPGVKSYSGYVHLPPGLISDINGEEQDYPINTFFWFFEARKDPHNAPLSIWLNGGPGASSMMGLLQENGPCFVGNDSNSTFLNPSLDSGSWNNEVNMLYLDQPTHVGFSYDIPANGTFNFITGDDYINIRPANFTDTSIPETNSTFLVGTFSSQSNSIANTTIHAAHALWHFAQTWFFEFPAYKPHDDRISIWAESYGGHYGPNFMKFFQEQNEKILNGTIKEEGAKYIHLGTLGIVNGLVDDLIQMPFYAETAYNNTYGIQHITKDEYDSLMDVWSKPNGCKERLAACQKKATLKDPNWQGDKPKVIKCFEEVTETCYKMGEFLINTKFGWYDIAHPANDPTPEPHLIGFLNQAWVQKALGVPVNYTASSEVVSAAFHSTADIERAGSLEALSYLLENNVKVHLMYGVRDFACNWLGGEAISLVLEYYESEDFRSAGYAPLLVDGELDVENTIGYVRQFGNYSFSRVFQAGHEVPWYQPEISYNIFMRSIFNKDIATGLHPVTDDFSTIGPSSTFHIKNEVPEWPEPKCYILAPLTCTTEVYATVLDGTAVIKDYFVVGIVKDEQDRKNKEELFWNKQQHVLGGEIY